MQIQGKVVPLPIDNIDTDQLIPANFLKQTDKKGFGKNLFYNWRYHEDYVVNPQFELNNPKRQGAKILIGGKNFGCGSSREHAAWAIADYGFSVVISSKFADIHKGNLYNNAVLPIELNESEVELLQSYFLENQTAELNIDIEHQEVKIPSIEFSATFEIPKIKKDCFLNGYDETEYLINMREEILVFENSNS